MFQTPIENRTPFVAMPLPLADPTGQEVLLVVLAATFVAPGGGELQIADEQSPIRPADVYRGNPAASSLVYEADVAITKPLVDVLVNGHAYAPGGNARRVPVKIQVGDVTKTLNVTGDRDRGGTISPFRTMPIVYERAYGGGDPEGRVDQRNPVGVGFRGALSADPEVKTTAPNIEYPQSGAPQPAGFGIVGRGWKPRIDFAGTYDQDWVDTRWPLLPADFDPRHNQAAPLDQQSRTLRGGEAAEVVNMTPNGRWRFRVPILDIPVHLIYEDRFERTRLAVDTILIEPDGYSVTLTARISIQTVRNTPLLEVVLGHVRRGWIRARIANKLYIDYSGHDGNDRLRSSVRL